MVPVTAVYIIFERNLVNRVINRILLNLGGIDLFRIVSRTRIYTIYGSLYKKLYLFLLKYYFCISKVCIFYKHFYASKILIYKINILHF